MNIGKAIRIARAETGLSQTELAKRAGQKTHTYTSLVETGEVNPTLDKVEKIAKALGMTASALVKKAEELS